MSLDFAFLAMINDESKFGNVKENAIRKTTSVHYRWFMDSIMVWTRIS